MIFQAKLKGPSLIDFIKPPKGPTMVDFLQAQEDAREAHLAAAEAHLCKRISGKGATLAGRQVLPNGVIKLSFKVEGL